MSEHTPGPWVRRDWAILDEAKRTVICNVVPWDVSGCRKEDVDNAHLIAAAPELFELMQYALAVSEVNLVLGARWQENARVAIAKAKGEIA